MDPHDSKVATNVWTDNLQNCELNGNWCGAVVMASSTSVMTSWTFDIGIVDTCSLF